VGSEAPGPRRKKGKEKKENRPPPTRGGPPPSRPPEERKSEKKELSGTDDPLFRPSGEGKGGGRENTRQITLVLTAPK